MAVVHVTGDTFEQEVLKAEGKVLVDFWPAGADHVRCLDRLLKKWQQK